jgi:hypothetical protein
MAKPLKQFLFLLILTYNKFSQGISADLNLMYHNSKFALKIDESTNVGGLIQLRVFVRHCFFKAHM